MTFLPATELVLNVPPPKVGRSSRRISGLVSEPDAVVGGRVVVVGAAVVGAVVGRVVGGVVVVDGGAVLGCGLVVGAGVVAVVPVVAVDGATVDAVLTDGSEVDEVDEVVESSGLETAGAPSPSTVTTRAPAGCVDRVSSSGAATALDVVGMVDAKVSTAAESGLEQEVMASPIASTASGGLERIRTL